MKLPHWLLIASSLATVVLSWLQQQQLAGTLVLPAVAVTALAVLSTLLGVLSPSSMPTVNAKAVDKAESAAIDSAIKKEMTK